MAYKLPNNDYHIDAAGKSTVLAGDNYGTIIVDNRKPFPAQDKERLGKILIESLTFDRMDARIQNVSSALASTCKWLFTHETFREWFGSSTEQQSGGFLWIKGNPGSGKSTIMKELVKWAGSKSRPGTLYTYFFNARSGNTLEKSSIGLFRSLVHQVLSNQPQYKDLFFTHFAWKVRKDVVTDDWTKAELQNFLLDVVGHEEFPAVTFFVDALDEGDDEDVRAMITFLDQLMHHATMADTPLSICLSSRYYPHINIDHALSISIDKQAEHMHDIELYVDQKLAGRDEEGYHSLHRMICDRSNGIFLWVILVIPILNQLNDQGKGPASRLRILEQIPQDLYEVFDEITARDWEDENESSALFRWVLFTLRPLTARELYLAVQVSLRGEDLDPIDVPGPRAILKWMLHCSHGLIEEINDGEATRFIHETVREYVREKELHSGQTRADQALSFHRGFPSINGHMRIAEDCLLWLTKGNVTADDFGPGFGRYAARNWWHHIKLAKSAPSAKVMTLSSKFLLTPMHFRGWEGLYRAALRSRHKDEFHLLGSEDFSLPLSFAIDTGIAEITRVLLDHGADPNGKYKRIFTGPLRQAVQNGDVMIVGLLLDRGAKANQSTEGESLLGYASRFGYAEITDLLISHGADVNATYSDPYHNPLQAAIAGGHEQVVQSLLIRGVNINAYERKVGMPLYNAAFRGHAGIARLLLDRGADINAQGGILGTALRAAKLQRHEEVVRLLLERGANDEHGGGTCNDHCLSNKTKGFRQTFRSMINKKSDSKSYKIPAR